MLGSLLLHLVGGGAPGARLTVPGGHEFADAYVERVFAFVRSGAFDFDLGPSHPIDRVQLARWVAAQPTPSLKTAARAFARSIRHISNAEVVQEIDNVARELVRFGNYPNTVVVLSKDGKSGFFFGLFVACHIFRTYGLLPKDFQYDFVAAFNKHGFGASYMDVDDMMYTGSQTFDLWTRYLQAFRESLPPDVRVGDYFSKLDYKLVRLFVSTSAYEGLRARSGIPVKLVSKSAKIPTLKDSVFAHTGGDDVAKWTTLMLVETLLNGNYTSKTAAYFDYKIADTASTAALPLVCGYVPSTRFLRVVVKNQFVRPIESVDEGVYPMDVVCHMGTLLGLDREMGTKVCAAAVAALTESVEGADHPAKFVPFVRGSGLPMKVYANGEFDEFRFQREYGLMRLSDLAKEYAVYKGCVDRAHPAMKANFDVERMSRGGHSQKEEENAHRVQHVVCSLHGE